MPLYYFHVRTERGLVQDEDGVDLPDLPSVINEALVSASEFLAEAEAPQALAFEVADEWGRMVLQLPIRNREAPLPRSRTLDLLRGFVTLH